MAAFPGKPGAWGLMSVWSCEPNPGHQSSPLKREQQTTGCCAAVWWGDTHQLT